MPIEPILDEVELLHAIDARLEGLAEHHTKATEELMTIAGAFATPRPSWLYS
jgi:hypothetical protein